MNTSVNTGVWFLSEMVNGIKRDRSSFRTPAQMSVNVQETDYLPFIWIGGLFGGLLFLLILKMSFKNGL